jgi:hypothetical protein
MMGSRTLDAASSSSMGVYREREWGGERNMAREGIAMEEGEVMDRKGNWERQGGEKSKYMDDGGAVIILHLIKASHARSTHLEVVFLVVFRSKLDRLLIVDPSCVNGSHVDLTLYVVLW